MEGVDILDEGGRFPSEALLGVDLHVKPGQTVSIVGRYMEGTQALARALAGLAQTQGKFTMNDVPVETLDPESLRKYVVCQLNDCARYEMSLLDNVVLGDQTLQDDQKTILQVLDDVGLSEVSEVVGLEGVLSFAMRLKGKPQREPQSGTNPDASGRKDGKISNFANPPFTGQGMRPFRHRLSYDEWDQVALARVLLRVKDADLVILEGGVNSVPKFLEVRGKIRAVRGDQPDPTIVFRMSSPHARLEEIDHVVYMDNNGIAAQGKHVELMEQDEKYAGLVKREEALRNA